MQYGIYDTSGNCWIGDDAGPRLFDDYGIARVAAEVYADVVGIDHRTYVAREFVGGPLRLKDEVPVKRTALQALKRIENGAV